MEPARRRDTAPLRVAMIGYAFMGAAHSQALAHGAPVLRPARRHRDAAALRPRPAAAAAAAAPARAGPSACTDWREVVGRDDIDVVDICTPGDTHARDRDRRARGRQARALREAAGQHRGRGRADDRRRPRGGRGEGVRSIGRASTTGASRRSRYARQLVDEGRVGRGAPHPRAVPAGLDRRPRVPAGLAAAEGQGRLGRARRHRRPRHRPGALRHRAPAGRRLGDDARRFVEQPPAARRVVRTGRERRRPPRPARSPSTTPPPSSAAPTAARWPPSRPPGSPPAARTRMRIEVNGSRGQPGVRLRVDERAARLRRDGAGHRGRLPPDPRHRARPPLRRRPGGRPGHGLGYEHTFVHEIADFVRDVAEGRDPSPSFADGLAVQRVLDAVERSAADESRWTTVDAG